MRSRSELREELSLFAVPGGGIGDWLSAEGHGAIFERLGRIDDEPLPAVQLNQLLVLGHEAPVSDGFFRYYWLDVPNDHPYDVRSVPGFLDRWKGSLEISSLGHLKWGLYRLYIDALLYFGNVRTAFRSLRDLDAHRLASFFNEQRFDTESIKHRGPALPLKQIAKDSRYLISEMACKSYGEEMGSEGDLGKALLQAYLGHSAVGNPSPTIRQLLEERVPSEFEARQQEFIFSADEVLEERVTSEQDLK